MEINCYRRSECVAPRYVAFFGRVTTEAGDLNELSELLKDYVKSEGANEILLLGGIKKDEKDTKSRALPKRVLGELAIILKNKTKRHILIA